jgi:RNA polymerase sigma-70 factor (ECF subfamily)
MTTNGTGTFSLDQLLTDRHWVERLARALTAGHDHGDGDDDDVVQETWLAALRRPPAADRQAGPWLARVVRNLAAKQRLSRQRRRAREAMVAAEAVPSPEALVARLELQRLLAELLGQLPDPIRQTLLLRYFQGHSAGQIGRLMAVPAGTVRWRLKRGRDQLRAQLDQRHGGQRDVWLKALLPLGSLRRPVRLTTRPPLAGAVLAMTVIAGGLWWAADRHQAGRADPRPPTAAVAGKPAWARSAQHAGVPRLLARIGPPPEGELTGRVIDPERRPVAGATVAGRRQGMTASPDADAELPVMVTAADGSFRYTGLSPGRYNLHARAPGLAVGGQLSIEIEPGTSPPAVDLQLPRGGAIFSGQVRDAAAGPIPGATVRVQGRGNIDSGGVVAIQLPGRPASGYPAASDFKVKTDAEGRFSIQLAHFHYAVTVRAEGYGRAFAQIELGSDVARTFRLEPTSPVAGQVVSVMGSPIAGAEVMALRHDPAGPAGQGGPWGPNRTDDEGNFHLPDLPPGEYWLLARKGALAGQLDRVLRVSAEGAQDPVQIRIGVGVEVSGRLRDADGPVGGARVHLLTSNEAWARIGDARPLGTADQDGRFRLTCVLPGQYQLEVFDRHNAPRLVERLLVSGPVTRDLLLPPAASVTGQVLTSDGRPAVGAKVNAHSTSPGPRGRSYADSGVTDSQGHFSLGHLGAGALTMQARLGDQTVLVRGQQVQPGRETQLVLRLGPAASLSGVVTWDDGTPAADARLQVTTLLAHPAIPSDRHRTDEQGRFRITGLPAGVVRILAVPGGELGGGDLLAASRRMRLTLAEGQHRPDVALVLPRRQHFIAGVVLDQGGQPAAGIRVMAALPDDDDDDRAPPRPGASALSGADGAFRIEELPAGAYLVTAAADDEGSAARSGVAAGTSDLRLVLGSTLPR